MHWLLRRVCEVLKLVATASHEVDVICKPEVADWPATNGDGGVVVLEGLLHDSFQEQVEEYWGE